MDESEYIVLCEKFEFLLSLPDTKQEEELKQIGRESPELADQLSAMLRADSKSIDDFLQSDLSLTTAETISYPKSQGANEPLESLGQYEIREKLGGGGMGLVFRAFDPIANREVALKIIKPELIHDDDVRARMLNEAQAVAKLSHPNIISVFDVAVNDGSVYFTMPIIEYGDLKSSLSDFRNDDFKIATLFLKIAQALGHAHQQGLIHRDVKPSNIMIDESNEPLLVDFGLAKNLTNQHYQTETGQFMGSLNYMAPEQIEDAKNVSAASDIYSFGATLYECLTGNPPFPGNDLIQLFHQIKTIKPELPSKRSANVNSKLERICMKCLEKNPSKRYPSMEEVEMELSRVLEGKPLKEKSNIWTGFANVANFRLGKVENFRALKAAVVILSHTFLFQLSIWLCMIGNVSAPFFWSVFFLGITSLVFINWFCHWAIYWHLEVTERQSAIGILFVILSLLTLFFIYGPTSPDGDVTDFLQAYPAISLAFALTLGAHGSVHAGKWLLLSLPFFPLAVILPLFQQHAPLVFGLSASAVLLGPVYDVYNSSSKTKEEEEEEEEPDSSQSDASS